ncbi:hypothetical protein [Tunicatimonas pelagia]|uniref:hypothetical protein n=1 Tax=Tunicatimonas pelagia TaxID=931531 RepID=UPI00266560B2|nr:hypothetical protein [Tunicatimonas pelagia]WKN44510.1 hypothetical protein P0M28_05970 [Tunicatimonas pelagia]
MLLTLKNSNTILRNSENKGQNSPTTVDAPRYRQVSRLADMSVGRIRRWGMPFRRPFSL